MEKKKKKKKNMRIENFLEIGRLPRKEKKKHQKVNFFFIS